VSQPPTADHGTGNDADTGRALNLCLYVTGQSPKSLRAIENLRRVCEEHLGDQCQIEVVDLLKDPRRAADDQILAVPMLVRKLPGPIRKIVGDLSNTDNLLVGLEIRESDTGQ
jgi:circadian clock protein KaiB